MICWKFWNATSFVPCTEKEHSTSSFSLTTSWLILRSIKSTKKDFLISINSKLQKLWTPTFYPTLSIWTPKSKLNLIETISICNKMHLQRCMDGATFSTWKLHHAVKFQGHYIFSTKWNTMMKKWSLTKSNKISLCLSGWSTAAADGWPRWRGQWNTIKCYSCMWIADNIHLLNVPSP